MHSPKLFMLLLGCRPAGRNTEQHDIFFGIANELAELIPAMTAFWRGSGKIHIDAWREVTCVDGYAVKVIERNETAEEHDDDAIKLFFINLGGYKEHEFEEYHYKMLVAAKERSEAIQQSKQTAFYKHCGFKGADSHIDDKYGIDVDDIYQIKEILPEEMKEKYKLVIEKGVGLEEDAWHLGYTKLSSLV